MLEKGPPDMTDKGYYGGVMGDSEGQYCEDCGGYDIEWMYRCHKHNAIYCRGCECPHCADDKQDELLRGDENDDNDL